jgi:hypothetical protein
LPGAVRVRLRVDGVLHDAHGFPKNIHPSAPSQVMAAPTTPAIPSCKVLPPHVLRCVRPAAPSLPSRAVWPFASPAKEKSSSDPS